MNRTQNILAEYPYLPEDFGMMNFPVNKIKNEEGKVFSIYPSLGALRSWKKKMDDKHHVMVYILAFYDRLSPAQKIREITKRKIWCACYAGWEVDDESGLFIDAVDDILKCRNRIVNDMIIDYLRIDGDADWMMLCVAWETYCNKMVNLTTQEDSTKKTNIELEKVRGDVFKHAITLKNDLKQIADEFLMEHNPLLRRDLFCAIDKSERRENLGLSAEDIIVQQEEADLPKKVKMDF